MCGQIGIPLAIEKVADQRQLLPFWEYLWTLLK